MNRIIIYPYKMSSQSSKLLAKGLQELGHKVLRVYPNRRYQVRPNDYIINWGNSTIPTWGSPSLNSCQAVRTCSNKQSTFLSFARDNTPMPAATDFKDVALQWISEGKKVFCRTLLTGHSGNGIVVATTPEEVVDAPLYTQEFKRTREYRVHVFNGQVLDYQEKKRKEAAGSRYDADVWNHGNDFVYARTDITLPACVREAAVRAIQAVGLDFGAVDVGYNHRTDECAVFEVNSAPGLFGTTLNKYVENIHEILCR